MCPIADQRIATKAEASSITMPSTVAAKSGKARYNSAMPSRNPSRSVGLPAAE
jgi:hypothetical protein